MAKLQLIFDGEVINEYDISDDEINIGRHPANDIVIENMGISGQHAKIEKSDDGEFYLVDKGSTNGTKLNGKKITKQQILKHGDNIGLFKHTLRFTILSSPQAQNSSADLDNKAAPEQEHDATVMLSADRLDNLMSEYRSDGEGDDNQEIKPHLEIRSPDGIRNLQLHDKSILIGKRDGCQINTGGWLFTPAISAVIKKDIGGSYSIRPETKIKINNKKTDKIQLLKHNDHIYIRRTLIIFKLHQ